MIVKLFTLFFVLTGLQGDKVEYIFDDQADGWLKLYIIPATWSDAKIRCDTEGAVIASPINEKLRDAISNFVERQKEQITKKVIAIYTGVHADYGDGDYVSIEGVKLSELPVEEWKTSPNTYRNSESCIVWDQIGYAKLRRVRCDFRFPYVCYKRRASLEPPRPPPAITPITESRPVQVNQGPSSGTNPDIQSHAPREEPQPDRWRHNNPEPSIYQTYSTERPQTNFQRSPNQWPQINQQPYQNPQTNPQSYFNQRPHQQNQQTQLPQTNFQSNSHQQSQIYSQYPSDKMPRINPENLPEYNSQYPSDKMPRINPENLPEYNSQYPSEKMPRINPENLPEYNSQYPSDKMPRINPENLPEYNSQYPSDKVPRINPENLPEHNSQYPSDNGILPRSDSKNLPEQGPYSKYSVTIAENGSMRHVEYQLKNNSIRSFQNVKEQTTQILDVAHEMDKDITTAKPSWPASSYSKFIRKAGGRFKLHMQPETFELASIRCASEGAVIASPLTNEMKNAITNFIKQNTALTTQFYTGVHANYSNGDFYSTEGVSLSKMPVYIDPNTFIDSQSSDVCLTMTTKDDIVSPVSCRDIYPYVCFKKSRSVRSCGKSDPAYEYKPQTQSCYKFHNDIKTWSEAYRVCSDEKGGLAVINSKEEAEVLKNLFNKFRRQVIKSTYKYSVYMGLRDWKDGKSRTTVQGVQSSGFIGWAPNEPRNNDCSTMSRRGLLHSDPCNLKLSFICEKDSEILYNDDDQDEPNS